MEVNREGCLMLEKETQTIKKALKLLPAGAERQAALEALEILVATMEVQGVRILQLNGMIPIDELGNPATQQYLDDLLKRPRV